MASPPIKAFQRARPSTTPNTVHTHAGQNLASYSFLLVSPLADREIHTPAGARPSTSEIMRELIRRLSFSDRASDGVPRGCVPVLVCDGGGGGDGERFVVRVEALRHPSFAALLEMAAQEFGYKQEGVLRVPCDVRHFKDVLAAVSSPRSRNS